MLMHTASVSSLPVLDGQSNVIGNISHVDVQLLTYLSALPLLENSCIHFISVILSERGMHAGQDSVPVFYVYHNSSLSHVVAKLVATRSHRMWIVDSPSPGGSNPQTPLSTVAPPFSSSVGPPYTTTHGASVSAASLPGQHMSGRLSGVVSLTDVLYVIAKNNGLVSESAQEARQRRRESSNASSTQG